MRRRSFSPKFAYRKFVEYAKSLFDADRDRHWVANVKALLCRGVEQLEAETAAAEHSWGQPYWIIPIGTDVEISERGSGEWKAYNTRRPLVFTNYTPDGDSMLFRRKGWLIRALEGVIQVDPERSLA